MFGMSEIAILLVVVALVVGAKKLPELARNAGCASVAVSYGAHDVAGLQQWSPLYVAHSVRDLGQWLKHEVRASAQS